MLVDENGFAAMLATKRSAGIAPKVNLRILLHAGNEACKQGDPPWLWNLGQTSPEVQNRSISGPRKRTDVLQIKKKTKLLKNSCAKKESHFLNGSTSTVLVIFRTDFRLWVPDHLEDVLFVQHCWETRVIYNTLVVMVEDVVRIPTMNFRVIQWNILLVRSS